MKDEEIENICDQCNYWCEQIEDGLCCLCRTSYNLCEECERRKDFY